MKRTVFCLKILRFIEMQSKTKKTTKYIAGLKNKRPLSCLTAYDALTARIADAAGIDLILVGDSVGTTYLGFDTTIPVTLEMMLHHSAAVSRVKPDALVVGDLPFGEMGKSHDAILEACRSLIQVGGVDAVKVEAFADDKEIVSTLVKAGIPVLGHIGLLPQRIQVLGSYKKFGKTQKEEKSLLKDAIALQEAGCFALIGEMIDSSVTAKITKSLDIPFIGIGCGNQCDGQILVTTDLLGMDLENKPPSFVKIYEKMGERMKQAFVQYKEEVENRTFPKS